MGVEMLLINSWALKSISTVYLCSKSTLVQSFSMHWRTKCFIMFQTTADAGPTFTKSYLEAKVRFNSRKYEDNL